MNQQNKRQFKFAKKVEQKDKKQQKQTIQNDNSNIKSEGIKTTNTKNNKQVQKQIVPQDDIVEHLQLPLELQHLITNIRSFNTSPTIASLQHKLAIARDYMILKEFHDSIDKYINEQQQQQQNVNNSDKNSFQQNMMVMKDEEVKFNIDSNDIIDSDSDVSIVEIEDPSKNNGQIIQKQSKNIIKNHQSFNQLFSSINEKYKQQLSILDPLSYTQNLALSDQIQLSQQIIRLQIGINLLKLIDLQNLLIYLLSLATTTSNTNTTTINNNSNNTLQLNCQFKIQGQQILDQKNNNSIKSQSFWTYTINVDDLLNKFIEYLCKTDQQQQQEKSQKLRELYKIIGFDTHMSNTHIINTLVDLKITKINLFTYKMLPVQEQIIQSNSQHNNSNSQNNNQIITKSISYPHHHDAKLTLYAISRARIQYLGQNIPIFRLKHSLFEALISAVHPEEVSPLSDSNLDLCKEDRQKHEHFMIKKLLEFYQNPHLKELIDLSEQGKTIDFIETFNYLNTQQNPYYSRYKIAFYDINIRQFVELTPAEGVEIYMVHYNGYVFGTNYPKLMVIRERESAVNQRKGRINIFDDDEDDFDLKIASQISDDKKDNEDLQINIESPLKQNKSITQQLTQHKDHSVYDHFELPQDLTEQIDTYKKLNNIDKDEDEYSEVEVKQAFIMNSSMLKSNSRRQKIDQLSQKNADKTCRSGLLAYKMEFENNQNGQQIIKRLVCYGIPGYGDNIISKVFEGKQAHILFLLWILQNSIDYFKDSRKNSRFINIFTLNGQGKEMSLILRGLVQVMGRDAHFIGDPNKLKLIWVENIRFYDIGNYFEEENLETLIQKWNIKTNDIIQDTLLTQVQQIFTIAKTFLFELRKIKFKDNQAYDFTLQGQGSGSSLGLSIFQYFYLDKQHIKGTHDLEIFEKEKQSMKSPYFYINQFQNGDHQGLKYEVDLDSTIYRLYKMDHSIASCFMNYPMPIEYSKQRDINIQIEFEQGHYRLDYKKHHSLYISQDKLKFKLMYSSLYHVKKLVKIDRTYSIPKQNYDGLDLQTSVLENEYIWGVELIEAIAFNNSNSIRYLHITEEIMYLQSRIFQPFIKDLIDNQEKSSKNYVQTDILSMILDSFHHRFTQKYVGMHLIIHINDLQLLRQTCISTDSQITKLYEISHPYYFIEYFPDGSDPLQQVGSLYRLNAYINACHRVMLGQQLSRISPKNIVFMDQQYLLIKNQWLQQKQQPQQFQQINVSFYSQEFEKYKTFGKYKLILQTQIIDYNLIENNNNPESNVKLTQNGIDSLRAEQQIIENQFKEYVKYFLQKRNLPLDIKEYQKSGYLQQLYSTINSLPKELIDISEDQQIQNFKDMLLKNINNLQYDDIISNINDSEFQQQQTLPNIINNFNKNYIDYKDNKNLLQSSTIIQQKEQKTTIIINKNENNFRKFQNLSQIQQLQKFISNKIQEFEINFAKIDREKMHPKKRYVMDDDSENDNDNSLAMFSQQNKNVNLKRKCYTQISNNHNNNPLSQQSSLMLSQGDIVDILDNNDNKDQQFNSDVDEDQDMFKDTITKSHRKAINQQQGGRLVHAFFTQQ